jgi:hypothetical protein
MPPKGAADPPPPSGFRLARELPVGRHPILAVFPGLDRLPPAARLEPDPAKRERLFGETQVELVDEDMWMYVAPREAPSTPRRRGWSPVVSPEQDCIVVGIGHLRDSPGMILYLDIYHELCHIVQRRDGANLWEPGVSYVERWTEVNAYRFVVEEAKALGVADAYLREYLRVEWISAKEHAQLLSAVGVGSPLKSRAARSS